MAKDLPEYLKQKLKARGILKDNQNAENSSMSETVCFLYPCTFRLLCRVCRFENKTLATISLFLMI